MFNNKKGANSPNYDRVDTLLGKTASINGTLQCSGTIRIDGTFEGELKVDGDVVVGETGRLNGNIYATNAYIAGKVEGNLKIAGQVHLTSSCSVHGDIDVSNLIVDEGAVFTGKCIMGGKEKMEHSPKKAQKTEDEKNSK